MINKNFLISIIFFFFNIINNNKIISYIILELENLPKENYKFLDNKPIFPEKLMKQIYYNNLITKLEIGSPPKIITALIELNSDKFYIASINPSDLKEKAKESQIYMFPNKDLYNELLSSTYKEGVCKDSVHGIYHYSEICSSKEKIFFNINNKNIEKEFLINIVRNNDENIPGLIGLLFNDTYSYYGQQKNIVTLLKSQSLIENYFFFFNFDKISPEKKSKVKLIIGSLPHEIFPEKYSIKDYHSTTSYVVPYIFRAWRLHFDKIYIEKKQNYYLEKTIIALNYEIYNIIGTMEFHYKIKKMFLNKLLDEKKCFYSNFSQNLFTEYNMTFYYCDINSKNILYENIPIIKFVSIDLDYTFEMTNNELFYIKDNYIYFNILFSENGLNFWLLGQIFTSKYNFVFNTNLKQIGIYKNENKILNINNNNNNKNNNNILITIIIIIIALGFTCLGLIIGRKIFGLKRKIIVNELIEEQNYDYKSYNKKNEISFGETSYKPIGKNFNTTIIEMKKKIDE